jgi:hypothetical protein
LRPLPPNLIPLSLPLIKGGIPLFGKEGVGEISRKICFPNYGLLSKISRQYNEE